MHYTRSQVLHHQPKTVCSCTVILPYLPVGQLLESHQLFLLYYHLFNLLSSMKDNSRPPELPIIPNVQHALLYNPETALGNVSFAPYNGGFQKGYPVALLVWKLTRLNHFNFRLRPVGLRTSCLTFGVTSAYPMFATR